MAHTEENQVDYLFEFVVNRRGQYIISRESWRDYKKQYPDIAEVLKNKNIALIPIGKNSLRIKKLV